jgi:plastocyanin
MPNLSSGKPPSGLDDQSDADAAAPPTGRHVATGTGALATFGCITIGRISGRRSRVELPAIALVLLVSACGGSSGPTAPDGGNVVAINIVGSNGNSAYTPNPAQVAAGASVMLTNYTTETHHIVMDDGSLDFGEIRAGASAERALRTGGGNFHGTSHRTMVGSINGQLPAEPRRCDPDFYDLSHCCDGFYC